MPFRIGDKSHLVSTTVVIAMLCVLTSAGIASGLMYLYGTITVTAERAPIRTEYPDGRIVDTAPRGTKLNMQYLTMDGRGMWPYVVYKHDNQNVKGFVDAKLTSFAQEMEAHRLKSGSPPPQ
jgi:hypothetical protein